MTNIRALEKEKTRQGCTYLGIRLGIFLALLVGGVSLLQWVFHLAFPVTDITRNLIPYQNHYLAATDAFITSEGMSSEFTDDMGIVGRFLGSCMVVLIGALVVNLILYIIPFTRKAIDYIAYILYLPAAIIVLIYVSFFPTVKTTFDSENNQLRITHYKWFFIPGHKSIPYSEITGFDYKFEDLSNYSHGTHGEYAMLYVVTKDSSYFIGENQIGTHSSSVTGWKAPQEEHEKINNVMQSLQQLVAIP